MSCPVAWRTGCPASSGACGCRPEWGVLLWMWRSVSCWFCLEERRCFYSSKGLIHFFTLFLKEKLTLTPLTERSVKTNVSDKSKGVSLSEKGWLTPHEALSEHRMPCLLISGSINFAQLTFSDSTPAIIEITLLNKLESLQLLRGLECWWYIWWPRAD